MPKFSIEKDERAVQDIEACLEEFVTNPFYESDQALRTLQSAIAASDELIRHDVTLLSATLSIGKGSGGWS